VLFYWFSCLNFDNMHSAKYYDNQCASSILTPAFDSLTQYSYIMWYAGDFDGVLRYCTCIMQACHIPITSLFVLLTNKLYQMFYPTVVICTKITVNTIIYCHFIAFFCWYVDLWPFDLGHQNFLNTVRNYDNLQTLVLCNCNIGLFLSLILLNILCSAEAAIFCTLMQVTECFVQHIVQCYKSTTYRSGGVWLYIDTSIAETFLNDCHCSSARGGGCYTFAYKHTEDTYTEKKP